MKAYICEECEKIIRINDTMLTPKEKFYLEINGMHFCSWECLGKFALEQKGDILNEKYF